MLFTEREPLWKSLLSGMVNRIEQKVETAEIDATMTFPEFLRGAWPLVYPGRAYVGGWHIDAIAEHLVAVYKGDIRRLIINIPPRHGKSSLVCVMWPAWVWTQEPSIQWLFSTYADRFAHRDALAMRRLVNSQWYRSHWGHLFDFEPDQNRTTDYRNTAGGRRMSTSVGGVATGDGGDIRVIDDPIKASDAKSDTELNRVIEWYKNTWVSRYNDIATVRDVVVMQRLHDVDLTGHLLEKGDWEHLMLPFQFEEERRCVTSIGFKDPRKEEGELLHPERYPRKEAENLIRDTEGDASSQLQQNPVPASGSLLKQHWWRFWQPKGANLPPVVFKYFDEEREAMVDHTAVCIDLPELNQFAQSWDMTFGKGKDRDFVAGGVWGRRKHDVFLLDLINKRLDFNGGKSAVIQLSKRWPKATTRYMEKKANGEATITSLGPKLPGGIIGVNPRGDKETRTKRVSGKIEAGQVYLPHPSLYPWVWTFINQCTRFPKGKHDDMVDMMTQILERWLSSGGWSRGAGG